MPTSRVIRDTRLYKPVSVPHRTRSPACRNGNWKMASRDWRSKATDPGLKLQDLPAGDSGGPASPAGMSAVLTHPEIVSQRPHWLAGELGFEPRFSESESDVLPLNYSPVQSREVLGRARSWEVACRSPRLAVVIYGNSTRFPSRRACSVVRVSRVPRSTNAARAMHSQKLYCIEDSITSYVEVLIIIDSPWEL